MSTEEVQNSAVLTEEEYEDLYNTARKYQETLTELTEVTSYSEGVPEEVSELIEVRRPRPHLSGDVRKVKVTSLGADALEYLEEDQSTEDFNGWMEEKEERYRQVYN